MDSPRTLAAVSAELGSQTSRSGVQCLTHGSGQLSSQADDKGHCDVPEPFNSLQDALSYTYSSLVSTEWDTCSESWALDKAEDLLAVMDEPSEDAVRTWAEEWTTGSHAHTENSSGYTSLIAPLVAFMQK